MSVIESNETTSPETKDPVVIKPTSWIDSWFDHFPFDLLPTSLLGRVGAIEPVRVEQFVDGDQLVIRAEMPGIEDDENIDVSVTGDRLTVAAKREQREESEEDGTFHSEFRYGSFSRTVKVPPGTDVDDITASYTNGIIEVRVKVATDTVESRKVKIERK